MAHHHVERVPPVLQRQLQLALDLANGAAGAARRAVSLVF